MAVGLIPSPTRARHRRSSNAPFWRCLLTIGTATGVLALTLVQAHAAFTWGSMPNTTTRPLTIRTNPQPMVTRAMHSSAEMRRPESGHAGGAGITWGCIGCASLLVTSVCQILRAEKHHGRLRNAGRRGVSCQATRKVCVLLSRDSTHISKTAPHAWGGFERAVSMAVTQLSSSTASRASAQPVPLFKDAPLEANAIAMLTGLFTESAAQAPAPVAAAPTSRARAARWVGRERRRASTRMQMGRGEAAAGSIARRRTGARMQPTNHADVFPVAYDPSLQRTKIQVGLRVSPRIHSASGRDSRSQASVKGASDNAIVFLTGNHFEATVMRR